MFGAALLSPRRRAAKVGRSNRPLMSFFRPRPVVLSMQSTTPAAATTRQHDTDRSLPAGNARRAVRASATLVGRLPRPLGQERLNGVLEVLGGEQRARLGGDDR